MKKGIKTTCNKKLCFNILVFVEEGRLFTALKEGGMADGSTVHSKPPRHHRGVTSYAEVHGQTAHKTVQIKKDSER